MIPVATFNQPPILLEAASAYTFDAVARGVFSGGGRAASPGGASEEGPAGEGAGGDAGTLEDTARREREYVRGRVREELGREPSEEEVDEWVREHTEGY